MSDYWWGLLTPIIGGAALLAAAALVAATWLLLSTWNDKHSIVRAGGLNRAKQLGGYSDGNVAALVYMTPKGRRIRLTPWTDVLIYRRPIGRGTPEQVEQMQDYALALSHAETKWEARR